MKSLGWLKLEELSTGVVIEQEIVETLDVNCLLVLLLLLQLLVDEEGDEDSDDDEGEGDLGFLLFRLLFF